MTTHLLTVSDEWARSAPGIISSFFAGIAVIVGLFTKKEVSSVKKDVVSVKEDVVSVKATGEANHTMSNSAMTNQIKATVAALTALSISQRRHAVSGQLADIAAADAIDVQVEAARKLLEEHQTQQAILDAKSGRGK